MTAYCAKVLEDSLGSGHIRSKFDTMQVNAVWFRHTRPDAQKRELADVCYVIKVADKQAGDNQRSNLCWLWKRAGPVCCRISLSILIGRYTSPYISEFQHNSCLFVVAKHHIEATYHPKPWPMTIPESSRRPWVQTEKAGSMLASSARIYFSSWERPWSWSNRFSSHLFRGASVRLLMVWGLRCKCKV